MTLGSVILSGGYISKYFLGTYQGRCGRKKPQARKTEGVSHKAPPPESGMSSDGGELKFEDFGPTEKNDFQPEAKINSAKPAVENQKSGSTAIGEREHHLHLEFVCHGEKTIGLARAHMISGSFCGYLRC